ncbi:eukaryotic translation initiation factor 3 subunit I-like, partial [Lingula anatina]
KVVSNLPTKTAVRSCGFSYGGNIAMYTTDKTMGQPSEIHIYDLRDSNSIANADPLMVMPAGDSKITASIWGPLDEFIITGHENGALRQWDFKSGDLVHQVKDHNKQINDIQTSKDKTMVITASKDCTAKLFDTATLKHMKTYRTERPVNSASISPLMDHVVLGGGQEAMDVTTTSSRIGKFDARFYHLIFEEEFGRVKGHFGPINSLAFHPDGKSYSSGGEDGFVRCHQFDSPYFEFDFEVQ